MTEKTLKRAKEIDENLNYLQAIKKIVYDEPYYVDCRFVISKKIWNQGKEEEEVINIDIPFEEIYSREELKNRVYSRISELQKELDRL